MGLLQIERVRTALTAARCSRATCAGMRTVAAGSYSVRASHHAANISEMAWAVLPRIAGFYERLSFVGGPHICISRAPFECAGTAWDRLAISTARIAVRTMPSKVSEVALWTWPSTQERNTCSKIIKAPGQAAHYDYAPNVAMGTWLPLPFEVM